MLVRFRGALVVVEDVSRAAAAGVLDSAARSSYDAVSPLLAEDSRPDGRRSRAAYGSTSWQRRAKWGSVLMAMFPVPPRPVVNTLLFRVGVWRSL